MMRRSEWNPYLIWCDICASWRPDQGADEREGVVTCAVCWQTRDMRERQAQARDLGVEL